MVVKISELYSRVKMVN